MFCCDMVEKKTVYLKKSNQSFFSLCPTLENCLISVSVKTGWSVEIRAFQKIADKIIKIKAENPKKASPSKIVCLRWGVHCF